MQYRQLKFDAVQLNGLLNAFRNAVTRTFPNDAGLADEIERELLQSRDGQMSLGTLKRLARWCKTNGNPYQAGMEVARQISLLLYGTVVDRKSLNT